MPYNVFKEGDKFCVYKHDENGDKTGDSLGCHPTEAEAMAQMRAIYAHEQASGPGPREYKSAPFFVKEIEDRTVKQYFAVMGNIDDGGDRLYRGAFVKTLNERLNRVKVLWQHDTTQPPVGVPLRMAEVDRGNMPPEMLQKFPEAEGALYGEVKYLPTPRGDEILTGIREGAITENSIGYDAISYDWEKSKDKVRNLKEVRLWDISPVNWGMNSATMNLKLAAVWGVADLERAIRAARAIMPRVLMSKGILSPQDVDRWQTALETLAELMTAAPPDEEQEKLARTAQGLLARLAIANREIP